MKRHFVSAGLAVLFAGVAMGAAPAAAVRKEIDALNAKFGLATVPVLKQVEFVAGEGGLICADITAPAGTGRVYLLGGHLTAWQPGGEEPVIFMSNKTPYAVGKAIRGGVPVCFPWFAGKAEGAVAGVGAAAGPSHGLVRTVEWQVEETRANSDGSVSITLMTKSDGETKAVWPGEFEIREKITVGKQLRIELSVKNTGKEEMKYEEALHCYYAVKDVRKAKVLGLEGVSYLDKTDGRKEKKQEGAVIFEKETDSIYMGTKGACTIVDELMGRKIVIEKTGSESTVVWNPGGAKVVTDLGENQWMNYVAVEVANVGANAIVLKPGETKTMEARVSVGK